MTADATCLLSRCGRVRGWAALWAAAGSALCAVALWYHVAVVQEHEHTLNKVLEYAPTAVVVCNSRGDVVYANDAVKKVTGFSEEDLVAGGVEQIIPAELRDAHRAAFQRSLLKVSRGIEGINYQRVMPVQCKGGGMIICMVSVGTVKHAGGPHFFAFVLPVATEASAPTSNPSSTPRPWRSPTLDGPESSLTEK